MRRRMLLSASRPNRSKIATRSGIEAAHITIESALQPLPQHGQSDGLTWPARRKLRLHEVGEQVTVSGFERVEAASELLVHLMVVGRCWSRTVVATTHGGEGGKEEGRRG